jgi:hypothetical protein
VAKSCLFIPPLDADLPTISYLADVTVTLGIGDAGAMPYFQDCKALSEYRQGHYAEAIEWAKNLSQFLEFMFTGTNFKSRDCE